MSENRKGYKFRKWDEIADFIKAAYECDIKNEDALAANNMGALYYGGRIGGEPDYEKAREYYEIADRLGYSLASENLAYIFYYGFETEVDYEKAYFMLARQLC